MVIVAAQATTVGVVAMAQRWIVDGVGLGVTWGLVGAALLGAVAHAAGAAGNRIQSNLRIDLAERVDLLLAREVLGLSGRIPTIEHLERPQYLDRLVILRAGARSLAASCWSATEMAAAFVSLGLSLWLLATVHPALTLLALLGVPPLLFAQRGRRLVRAALDANAEAMRREWEIHALCVQPEPAKEVRIAGNAERLGDLADGLWNEMSRRETRARVRGAMWQLAGWACFGLGFAAATVLVTRLAISNAAGLGDIVLVVSLAVRLRGQIDLAVDSVNEVAEAGNVAEHYLWLRDYAAAHPDGDRPAPARLTSGIRLSGVSFRYPGAESDVLTGVTLDIPAGSTVALVGVNGAGKSTLVKLLTGMYEPTEGHIEVDGEPLPAMARHGWFAVNSGVFQDFAKFQLTAGEVVGLGELSRLDDRQAITSAVEHADAAPVVASLANGLNTQLGRTFGGAELSHGQWQRLALARSLMRERPLLLVLDEPTAALDPQAEHDLFERFVAASRDAGSHYGTVTLLVSHRLSTVHMADHIVMVGGGRIIEQGSHDELMARDGDYAGLYRVQAGGYTT
ncbi:ABC transporter ATP-binding protein [Nonomuraea angiospora]|uniref:ATP-binding cassette subfamily B protein n=1 Tax=Nonomuraea angiospora TaxID=46172 RepID=A0ABR9LNS5_9ACTN|nr:ABC transporter ATP-binding protein [Nonomuraea angiospora]MBE1582309.1 ATP-binding cassette subfamily B protein [Nonomuraea angiospora]